MTKMDVGKYRCRSTGTGSRTRIWAALVSNTCRPLEGLASETAAGEELLAAIFQ
jgi:hypothetical protein